MRRWIWWVAAIAVWIGLAEGLPVLWDAGGRDAWAWVAGQNEALGAWFGEWSDDVDWSNWLAFGVILIVAYAMSRIDEKLTVMQEDIGDIRSQLADMDHLAEEGRRLREYESERELWEASAPDHLREKVAEMRRR